MDLLDSKWKVFLLTLLMWLKYFYFILSFTIGLHCHLEISSSETFISFSGSLKILVKGNNVYITANKKLDFKAMTSDVGIDVQYWQI